MLILILITSCVWFGIGILVGWQRSKRAYELIVGQSSITLATTDISVRRSAQARAVAVFLGWTVAGLLGAVICAALWVFLLFAHAAAETSAQSRSRKKGDGDLWTWILLGGLLVINEDSLRSIEQNADDFVIGLAIVMALVVAMVVAATR